MAHEVETMAYAHETPWHGLGVQVEGNLTPEQMLVAAGLDWEVEKRELFYKGKDGVYLPSARQALVRVTDDRYYSAVGEGWNPLQNRDAFEFFKEYCEAGGATMETAGSLRNGQVVWGLANLNHGFTIKGDAVKGYLFLQNPHEFGKTITGGVTAIRIVCANTLRLALNSKMAASFRFNHSRQFNHELAREAIGLAHEQLSEFEKNVKLLMKLNMSYEDAVKVLSPVYQPGTPAEDILDGEVMMNNSMNRIMACISEAPGATPGNGWGVMNGVTYYADHVAGRTQDTRLSSSWLGVEAGRKDAVFNTLLEMAQ